MRDSPHCCVWIDFQDVLFDGLNFESPDVRWKCACLAVHVCIVKTIVINDSEVSDSQIGQRLADLRTQTTRARDANYLFLDLFLPGLTKHEDLSIETIIIHKVRICVSPSAHETMSQSG